jgi:hypothetical protein
MVCYSSYFLYFLTTLLWKPTYNTTEGWDPTDCPLHTIFAQLCVWKVRKNMKNDCLDISFFMFLTHSHMCQWLPQIQRATAWASTTLLPKSRIEIWGKKIATQCQKIASNIHSLHLVALFADGYQSQPSNTNSTELIGMPPSYQYVTADNSITQEELILQQCNQGSELNWEHISLENRPLNFVLLLIEAYFQPLKLLATLQPLSLFHLLESATLDRYPRAIKILENALVSLSSSQPAMELVCY